jgi:membrane associated rhomboid family serine protease
LACAGTFGTLRATGEYGLVVLAMGLPYWLEESAEGFGILVEPGQLGAVQREFALYEQANRNWPPRSVELPAMHVVQPWFTPMLWAIIVVWVFGAQMQNADSFIASGALDGAAIWRNGEWWRLLTSQFLHADLRHLLGNVTIGVFVFTQVVIARGALRAWVGLALAALAANALTAAIHLHDETVTIGASTMVFSGIGMLTGAAVAAGWRAPQVVRWRAMFVSISAGLVLLALLGTGDARTDVIAHALGFVAGLIAGAASRKNSVAPATNF